MAEDELVDVDALLVNIGELAKRTGLTDEKLTEKVRQKLGKYRRGGEKHRKAVASRREDVEFSKEERFNAKSWFTSEKEQ